MFYASLSCIPSIVYNIISPIVVCDFLVMRLKSIIKFKKYAIIFWNLKKQTKIFKFCLKTTCFENDDLTSLQWCDPFMAIANTVFIFKWMCRGDPFIYWLKYLLFFSINTKTIWNVLPANSFNTFPKLG